MIVRNALFTIALCIPLSLLVLFSDNVGQMEGARFPVVTPFTLLQTYSIPNRPDQTGIVVTFAKMRNCEFAGIDWYIKDVDNKWVEREVIFPEDGSNQPTSKPVGEYKAYWIINAPISDMHLPMKTVYHHNCWTRIGWVTETITNVISKLP